MSLKRVWVGGVVMVWMVLAGCSKPLSILDGVQTVQDAQSTLSDEVDHVLASESMSMEQKSERILEIGKDSIESPKGFSMAKAVFDEALKANPKNEKAEFYSTVLEVPMAFQGILFDTKDALTEDAQKEILDALAQNNQSDISDFLNKQSVPTTLKIKAHTDQLRALQGIDDHFNIVISKPSQIQRILENKMMPVLENMVLRLDVFFLEHPEFSEKINLSLFVKKEDRPLIIVFDQAAYLALKTVCLAAISAIKILVSYDLDDIKLLEAHIKSFGSDPSPEQIVMAILDHPKFLTLIKTQYLSSDGSKRVLLSLEKAFLSAHALFDLLTALDSDGNHIRQKHYAQNEKWFPNLDPNDANVIHVHEVIDLVHDLIDDSKNADGSYVKQPVTLENIGKNKDINLRVDLTAFLSNRDQKFSDLKIFLPTFNLQEPVFSDLTFGGVFPDSDFIHFLKSQDDPTDDQESRAQSPLGDVWQGLPEYNPEGSTPAAQ